MKKTNVWVDAPKPPLSYESGDTSTTKYETQHAAHGDVYSLFIIHGESKNKVTTIDGSEITPDHFWM